MKEFVVPVLFFLSVSLARATDVNCPAGGEMDLDEIINVCEMMEENVVQDCNDLANYLRLNVLRSYGGKSGIAILTSFGGSDEGQRDK